MLKGVTINEIEAIFAVIERFAISREAVIIPLKPSTPGVVRRLPNGKVEIVVDSGQPFEEWLAWLERQLRELTGRITP